MNLQEYILLDRVPDAWRAALDRALTSQAPFAVATERSIRFRRDAAKFCLNWADEADAHGLTPDDVFPHSNIFAGPVGFLDGEPVRAIEGRSFVLPTYAGRVQRIRLSGRGGRDRRWERRDGRRLWTGDRETWFLPGGDQAIRLDIDWLRQTAFRCPATLPEQGLAPLAKSPIIVNMGNPEQFHARLETRGFKRAAEHFGAWNGRTRLERIARAALFAEARW